MKYEISTGPALLPVSVEEAKAHLRVDGNDEDSTILSMIGAATAKVEKETGRALMSQTVKAYWDTWPDCGVLELPIYPAASITNVKYIDVDGVLQTWSSANYTSDLVGMCARVMPVPDVDLPEIGDYPNAVQVTYVAGSSTTNVVPEDLKYAILTTVALLYEHRVDMPLSANTPGVRTAQWLQFSHRQNLV